MLLTDELVHPARVLVPIRVLGHKILKWGWESLDRVGILKEENLCDRYQFRAIYLAHIGRARLTVP
jgi:hypothetical protein